MTTQARQVLEDCQRALDDLSNSLNALWRVRWVGMVALLRAVGHVLDKVDGNANTSMRKAVDAAWQDLHRTEPSPAIYHEFIEDERNNVLKVYRFGSGVNITVRPGAALINLRTGESGSTPSGPTTYEAFIRTGAFAGRDALDVCREAIEFWRKYLDDIDAQVAASGPSAGPPAGGS